MATREGFTSFNAENQAFSDYLDMFEQYVVAHDIPEARQKAVFLSSVGAQTYALLRSLVSSAKPADKSLEELKQALSEHLIPEPLEIAETYKFHCRHQLPGETAREFLAALRLMARHCGFEQFLPKALRNQLVCGLACNATRQKLLTVKNLTLEGALDIAAANEQSLKELEGMRRDATPAAQLSVDRVSEPQCQPTARSCATCGSTQHERRRCPHYHSVCHGCGIRGHLQKVCRNKRQPDQGARKSARASSAAQSLNTSEDVRQVSDDTLFIHTARSADHKPCMIRVAVEGVPVTMEFDTGSSIPTLSLREYERVCPHLSLESTNITLRPYGGTKEISPVGVIHPEIEYRGRKAKARLFILAEVDIPLFGREYIDNTKYCACGARRHVSGCLA